MCLIQFFRGNKNVSNWLKWDAENREKRSKRTEKANNINKIDSNRIVAAAVAVLLFPL